MRLLRYLENNELEFREYLGLDIPPYAILSHTWGADHDEVSYHDLVLGKGQDKPGYVKLRFCAEQVGKDGLQYFWIDTCCIDQTSSAELTEAINSMFKWYSNAATCYVFLSDIIRPDLARDLEECRWFTRGWTLQELIAPKSVQFFTAEGESLGDKHSLERQISKVTGIPADAFLSRTPLSRFTVDERLSWAKNRHTKREEDAIYSLWGIFGIHLPVIYGEGKDNALVRLKQEIHAAENRPNQSATNVIRTAVAEILKNLKSCLETLHFSTMVDREHTISENFPSTCDWIFETESFARWWGARGPESSDKLLWVKGKPGSGKSTLMKHVYQRSREKLPASWATVVAFFFNARGSPLEKSQVGLFRSILYQILRKDYETLARRIGAGEVLTNTTAQDEALIHEELRRSYPFVAEVVERFNRKVNPTDHGECRWYEDELRALFQLAFTSRKEDEVIIFVDALDECPEKEMRLLVNCFQHVIHLTCDRGSRVRICLSSRHYPIVTVPQCLELVMELYNHDDIVRYVEANLGPFQHPEAQRTITEKASGIFLWVELVVEALIRDFEDGKSASELETAFQHVPESLEKCFVGLLESFAASERETACSLFQWVLLAQRPLNPEELCLAMAFTPERRHASICEWRSSKDRVSTYQQMIRRIRSFSRGLIVVTDSSVQVVHETVRELFLRGNGFAILSNSSANHPVGSGHLGLARACLNIIDTREVDDFVRSGPSQSNPRRVLAKIGKLGWTAHDSAPPRGSEDSILTYAVENLFYHSRQAEDDGVAPYELVDRFGHPQNHLWDRWRYLKYLIHHNTATELVRYASLLYILCQDGITSCVERLLELGANPNETGGFSQYPLIAAVQGAFSPQKLLQTLLRFGADTGVKDRMGWTALHVVCHNGQLQAARLLMNAGASLSVKDNLGWTVLHVATFQGHDKIVRLLLQFRPDVNIATIEGETAICMAATFGDETICRLLERNGAKIDLKNPHTQGVLLKAVRSGRELPIRLLLGRQPEVYVRQQKHESQLSLQQTATHELLDSDSMTVVSWAACRGDAEVARALLRHGFKVSTALHQAAEWGHESTIRILIENGADTNERDTKNMVPLHYAVKRPDESVTRLLLAANADVNASTPWGGTSLHMLADQWETGVAKALIAHRANLEAKDNRGRTVLHLMVKKVHKAAVKLLLKHGANVHAKDEDGTTPLHEAVKCRDEAIARLLLSHRANVNAKDIAGRTPLHFGAKASSAVVRPLIECGAHLDSRNWRRRTPLHVAAEWASEEVVQLLLAHGADVNAVDDDGKTPIEGAIRWNKREIVHLLGSHCG